MTPAARRLVLQADAVAHRGSDLGNTLHARQAGLLRRLAAERDAGWPPALMPVVEACIALSDAFDSKDGSRHMRAVLRIKDTMRHYIDATASADVARDERGR